MNFFKNINSHKYIDLDSIIEGQDGVLRIIIKEAGVNADCLSINAAGMELSAQAIVSNEDSRTYEIIFERYIGHSVIDESYALPNDDEVFEGKLFCVYKKFTYLD